MHTRVIRIQCDHGIWRVSSERGPGLKRQFAASHRNPSHCVTANGISRLKSTPDRSWSVPFKSRQEFPLDRAHRRVLSTDEPDRAAELRMIERKKRQPVLDVRGRRSHWHCRDQVRRCNDFEIRPNRIRSCSRCESSALRRQSLPFRSSGAEGFRGSAPARPAISVLPWPCLHCRRSFMFPQLQSGLS